MSYKTSKAHLLVINKLRKRSGLSAFLKEQKQAIQRIANQGVHVNSLEDISSTGAQIEVDDLEGNYNSGRSVFGTLGIDHEGIGGEQVYHVQQGSDHFYHAAGMFPNAGGDAAFCFQSWKNPGTDVIVYGDFEAGDFTGWQTSGGGAISEAIPGWNVIEGDAYYGDYYASYINDGTTTANSAIRVNLTSSLTPGVIYFVNAYMRLSAPSANVKASIYVAETFTSGGGGGLGTSTIRDVYIGELTGSTTGADRWLRVSGGFTCPVGMSAAFLYLKAQNLSGTEAFTADFDLITVCPVDSYYLHNFSESLLPQNNSYTVGLDNNRNTSSSYTTQIMVLRVARAMTITQFLWDVRNTGDYELHYLWGANIAYTFETLWSATVGAAGEQTITPAHPVSLYPGTYYFGLTRTTGSATWYDYNAVTYAGPDNAWVYDGIYYNTTGYNYVPPCKLVYTLND